MLFSDVEICTFKRKINTACFDLDCLNTKHALQLILELKVYNYARGSFIAQITSQRVSLPKSYTNTQKWRHIFQVLGVYPNIVLIMAFA